MTREGRDCAWAERTVLLALHALDPGQEEAVARHVRRCPACRATLRDAEETFAAIGETAATAPPPGLRDRVLAGAQVNGGAGTLVQLAGPRPDRRRWVTAVAAAVLVAAIAGGGVAIAQIQSQRDAATVHAGTVDDLLAAITKSPHAVLVDRDRRPVAAVALGAPPRFYDLALPAPDAGRTWVLWGMRGRAATPLSAVPADPAGAAATPVGRLGDFEAYVLTQEDTGPPPVAPGEIRASGPVTGPG